MDDPLYDMVCKYEAKQRFAAGEKPGYSQGLCGFVTCGYGRLDSAGYWQFPLYPLADEINKAAIFYNI